MQMLMVNVRRAYRLLLTDSFHVRFVMLFVLYSYRSPPGMLCGMLRWM